MRWTIDARKYLQLHSSEIEAMFKIELSCKDDPTPIYTDYDKFVEYLKAGEAIFVLKSCGIVVGYAVLEKKKGNVWYLQNLAVVKGYRGLGWGKLLVRLRIKYAECCGATSIYMHCGVLNYPIQRIYEGLGFIHEECIHNHYGHGEHAYKMSKQLKEEENG